MYTANYNFNLFITNKLFDSDTFKHLTHMSRALSPSPSLRSYYYHIYSSKTRARRRVCFSRVFVYCNDYVLVAAKYSKYSLIFVQTYEISTHST